MSKACVTGASPAPENVIVYVPGMGRPSTRYEPTGSMLNDALCNVSAPFVTAIDTPPSGWPVRNDVTWPVTVATTPVNCWAGASVNVNVCVANPDLLKSNVKVAGVGRLRRVNAPMSSCVSDTVPEIDFPSDAVIVTPPIGPFASNTCPLMSPSPLRSRISTPARLTRCTSVAKPSLLTVRSYVLGEGTLSRVNVPSAPTGAVVTNGLADAGPEVVGVVWSCNAAPLVPPVGVTPGTVPGIVRPTVAPAASVGVLPKTWPEIFPGTPPRRMSTPFTACPADACTSFALSGVSDCGYQSCV